MRQDVSPGTPGVSGVSGARLRWPWGALLVGVLYFLCWAGAEVTSPRTSSGQSVAPSVIFCLHLALLLGPPWLLILLGVPRDTGARPQLRVRLMALGATLAGALPALVCTFQSLGTAVLLSIVLPPGFSIGAAVAFVWGVRARARGLSATKGGRRATLLGALGFALPLIVLPVVEFIAFTTFAKPTDIHTLGAANLVFAFIILSMLGLLLTALTGFGLVELGGWLGTSLAGRDAGSAPTTA